MKRRFLLLSFCRISHFNNVKLLGSQKGISSFHKCNMLQYQTSELIIPNKQNERQEESTSEFGSMKKILTLSALTASSIIYCTFKNKIALCKKSIEETAGQFVDGLPTYNESEISKHSTEKNRIWVTFKNGVYDITDFISQHPGGNKILLAAGSSIEPFWSLYGVHNNPEIYNMLEEYRIGNIDSVKHNKEHSTDPYGKDPKRHPVLKAASVKPYNAEPPAFLLAENFYTPNSIFYVRNHLPVPEVDIETYKLEIKGIGIKEKSFTLEDIKNFPKYTISAAIQCAGNRRSEMSKVKPVKGLSWNHGAIGNATWAGAKLTDVLKSCGLNLNYVDIKHVHFEGLDKGPDNVPYAISIPGEKALDPTGDVILAYEMNGEELSRDHGYPIRAIIPGIVGARNVKWLSTVKLSEKESDSHWQQNDYKGFSPNTDWDTVDFKSAPAIQELPVISAICTPVGEEKVNSMNGFIPVKGYAWSGGGKRIIRVDVSSDKGKTWHVANLEQSNDNPPRHWSWTLWSINLPVAEEGVIEIWSKAVDSSYNTQPENMENIWNLRGVLSNSYHKVEVKVYKS